MFVRLSKTFEITGRDPLTLVYPLLRAFDFNSVQIASNLCTQSDTKLLAMFKPTQPLFRRLRRLALTTKQVNGGYYKGTGSGSMGWHTKHGGYIIDWRKVRTYVVPENLEKFKVFGLDPHTYQIGWMLMLTRSSHPLSLRTWHGYEEILQGIRREDLVGIDI